MANASDAPSKACWLQTQGAFWLPAGAEMWEVAKQEELSEHLSGKFWIRNPTASWPLAYESPHSSQVWILSTPVW